MSTLPIEEVTFPCHYADLRGGEWKRCPGTLRFQGMFGPRSGRFARFLCDECETSVPQGTCERIDAKAGVGRGMVNDSDHANLKAEWREAFDALRAAGLEADADHPIAARCRAASNAVNHANRSRDFAIATGLLEQA